MDSTQHTQKNASSADEDQYKIAVPYVSPPPLDKASFKKFRSPLINGIVAAFVILLAGFMAYNFWGHQSTRLAGESDVHISPTPTISPTVIPTPTTSPSGGY